MINLNVTLIIQLCIFLTLMVLLNFVLFKPMVRVLELRKERTEGRKKQASQLDGEAEAIWAEYQKRVQEARADADRVRTDLVRQGEAERQKLVEAATAQAEKAVGEVKAQVRGEADAARKALEAEARLLAGSIAQSILGRKV